MTRIPYILGLLLCIGGAFGQGLEEARRAGIAVGRAGPAAPQPDVREQFLAIERVARIPRDERKAQIPRLYTDLAPPLMNYTMEGMVSSRPAHLMERDRQYLSDTKGFAAYADQLEAAAGTMTPEEVADKIIQTNSQLILRVASRRRAIQVMQEHPAEMKTLIDADLESDDLSRVSRAYSVIEAIPLSQYGERLVKDYLGDGPRSEQARRTLLFMREPSMEPLLMKEIEANPRSIIKHGGLLAGVMAGKPASPTMMKLLESPDAEVRLHATIALEMSRDPRLGPMLPRLVAGGDPRTIEAALMIAVYLPNESFAQAREALLPLMNAQDQKTATLAAWVFATQKDIAAGPVLLKWIQLPAMDESNKVRISQAMSRLTGISVNYDMHSWGPQNPRNQAAIAKFSTWIEQNSPKQP